MWMEEILVYNDVSTRELRKLGSLSQNLIKRLIRASPMALHLHVHLRFFIRDADANAGFRPQRF